MNRPRLDVRCQFGLAIARAHQNASCSGVVRGVHVAVAIPNHEGSTQVQPMFACSLSEHAGFRFAAFAIMLTGVRAIVDCVYARSGLKQLLLHQFVNAVYRRFGKESASDPRLVCDYDYRQLRLVQTTNGPCSERKHTKMAGIIQVANLFGNSAVAIEKHRGPRERCFKQDAPPRMPARNAPQPQRRPAIPASCSDDRSGIAAESTGCSTACPERLCIAASLVLCLLDRWARTPPPPVARPRRQHASRPNRFQ